MKQYRLKKDLPTFKAGDEFFINEMGSLIAGTPEEPKKVIVGTGDSTVPIEVYLIAYAKEALRQFPNVLTDWFEEIDDESTFYFIDVLFLGKPIKKRNIDESSDWFIERLKSLGSYFKTEQEAEEHLEWLKARATLLKDTKGFKPDWNDADGWKYCVYYDHPYSTLKVDSAVYVDAHEFYFETKEDAKFSIKLHEKEWRIYLGVEK